MSISATTYLELEPAPLPLPEVVVCSTSPFNKQRMDDLGVSQELGEVLQNMFNIDVMRTC